MARFDSPLLFKPYKTNRRAFYCFCMGRWRCRGSTTDTIEAIGIARAREKMQEAALILYIFDLTEESLHQ